MGTSGVPWDATKSQIIESIKKQYGRITYVAKELNCDYITVKRRVDKDPELQQILAEARSGFGETLLDMAESSLMRGLSNEDPAAYLKAAMYVLNNKGKERGYNSWIEEKQFAALSGLQQYWKDHEVKPEMMESFAAYCKTLEHQTDAQPQPGDKTD